MKTHITIVIILILSMSGCSSGESDNDVVNDADEIQEMNWDQADWGEAKWK